MPRHTSKLRQPTTRANVASTHKNAERDRRRARREHATRDRRTTTTTTEA